MTADYMRIIDWISDVCSSDLVDQLEQGLRGRFVGDFALQRRAPGELDAFGFAELGFERLGDFVQAVDDVPDVVAVLGRFDVDGAGVERGFEVRVDRKNVVQGKSVYDRLDYGRHR